MLCLTLQLVGVTCWKESSQDRVADYFVIVGGGGVVILTGTSLLPLESCDGNE